MRQDKIHIPAAIPFSSELLALEKSADAEGLGRGR